MRRGGPGGRRSRRRERGCGTRELCSTGEGCDLVRGGSPAPGACTASRGLPESIAPMAADKQTTPDAVPRVAQEFIGKLRAATQRLEDHARFGGPVTPATVAPASPAALS